MMDEYVLAALINAEERNQAERRRLRRLRDQSNPFELNSTKFKKLFRIPPVSAKFLVDLIKSHPQLNEADLPPTHVMKVQQNAVAGDTQPVKKKNQSKVQEKNKNKKDNKNGTPLKYVKKVLTNPHKKNEKDKAINFLKRKKTHPGDDKAKLGFKTKKLNDGPTEKPKWSEMKKEKKQLRIKRRQAKITADVFVKSSKAKLLAAQIQRKVTKPEVKLSACNELHALLKGQYKTLALTHDLSRVIQVLLKYCPENIKTEITEELIEIIVQMAQSKYAHHTVRRILKYGTDFIRHEVIKKFYGNIVSLATHTISAPLLDYAYGEFATKKEKQLMQQEFYGDIFKNVKDNSVKSLSDAYKNSPQLKSAILNSCKANIQKILDKNLHDGEVMHSVLYEYMMECGEEERRELSSQLSGLVVPLTNSLPGANAACLSLWHATNKDKKTILKAVKEHAVALATHKTGYRLLLAIFDSVDDTVLVTKTVIAAIIAQLRTVVGDHWGNMVVHWLVKPKDTSIFHPTLVRFLEEGAKSGTSKKDAETRAAELREAILPTLIQDISENPEFWLSTKNVMLLLVAVLSIKSPPEVVEGVAREVCRADWKVNEALAVEDAGVHMCLKKMAAIDANTQKHTFANAICNHLKDSTLKLWLSTNRGCFFLLKLIQHNNDDISNQLKNKIKTHSARLKKQSFDGAKLLDSIIF